MGLCEVGISLGETSVKGIEVGTLVAHLIGQIHVETLDAVAQTHGEDVGITPSHVACTRSIVHGSAIDAVLVKAYIVLVCRGDIVVAKTHGKGLHRTILQSGTQCMHTLEGILGMLIHCLVGSIGK